MSNQKSDRDLASIRGRWGYWCEQAQGSLWVFVPNGTDPIDGAPLTLARRCSLVESRMWNQKRYAALARMLIASGAPVAEPRQTVRSRLGRIMDALMGR